MNDQQARSANTPNKRVGIYERLGRSASGSPVRMFGMGLGILAILIVLIIILSVYL